jgi:hypothetical protein
MSLNCKKNIGEKNYARIEIIASENRQPDQQLAAAMDQGRHHSKDRGELYYQ